MASLKDSKTEGNQKAAFAGESQANRRYLYFAQKADVEGFNDVAAVFLYCGIATFIILKVIDMIIGLRVSKDVEVEGLDINLHGETVHG